MEKATILENIDGRKLVKASCELKIDSLETSEYNHRSSAPIGTVSKDEATKRVLEALDNYYNRMNDTIYRYCNDNGIDINDIIDENRDIELVPISIIDAYNMFRIYPYKDNEAKDFFNSTLEATFNTETKHCVYLFMIPHMDYIPKKLLEGLDFGDKKILIFNNISYCGGEEFFDIELEVTIAHNYLSYRNNKSFKCIMDENTVKYHLEQD